MAADAPLWALVSDLFLRVKIEALARGARRPLLAFATAPALLERLAVNGPAGRPALVLVDLGAAGGGGFALLEALAGRADSPPTLAYFSHVDDAARRRAIELGATRVVPRSALVARFEALVAELAPAPPPAAG